MAYMIKESYYCYIVSNLSWRQHGFDTAAYTQTDPPMNSTGPGAESDGVRYLRLFCFICIFVKQTDILIPVSYFSSRHQQGHAGSKTLHQQNSPVLNWGCRLLQVDLFNGYKADVVVVVVVVVDILVHETKTVC